MCGCVGRRVIWRQALIGWWVANHQWLLPQQRLAKLLLPPVVHLSREVIWVSSKDLVPTSLQQDAVLEHTQKNIWIYCLWKYWPMVSTCKTTLTSALWMFFTLGLLQLETILSILLFRSSILGMLNLYKKNNNSRLIKRKKEHCKGKTVQKNRGKRSVWAALIFSFSVPVITGQSQI